MHPFIHMRSWPEEAVQTDGLGKTSVKTSVKNSLKVHVYAHTERLMLRFGSLHKGSGVRDERWDLVVEEMMLNSKNVADVSIL